jgi:putative transposase
MNLVPFSREERVHITQGMLPHWRQDRRTYFVTWRTADSIPAKLFKQWQTERDAWLQERSITRDQLNILPAEQRREYHDLHSSRWQNHLDDCHGECLLRRLDIRNVIEAALRHFEGQRYELGDFVLMPNHVHLLVTPADGEDIERLCFSWKRFSGGSINKLLGRQGEFWQPESFDHIVRSASALQKTQAYIAENPVKARLKEYEFTLYQPASWRE